MGGAQQSVGRGLSVAGATLVGAASLLVGASAVQHVLTGVEGLSSPDGLTRILSPAIIATGLVAGGLASAALVGSWRATKSRGLRHGSAVIAGVLVVCGAALMYSSVAWADRLLPALGFGSGAIGTGVAVAGWILGGASHLVPPERWPLRGLAAASAAVAALLPVGVGIVMASSAAEEAQMTLPNAERARILEEADAVWDNPILRLVYLEVVVTDERWSVFCGTTHMVEAFTLFGLRVDSLGVNDCGEAMRQGNPTRPGAAIFGDGGEHGRVAL